MASRRRIRIRKKKSRPIVTPVRHRLVNRRVVNHDYAGARILVKLAPRWSRIVVSLEVGVRAFAAFDWWREHIARDSYLFLAHQNLKPRAGPRKMFTHSSSRVSPDH